MNFDELLSEIPLIAILRGLTPERAIDVGATLVDAGFRCLEVPLNSPQPFESIRLLAERFGDQAIIGAGTVIDAKSVGRLAMLGARIVVSPNCDVAVIRAAKASGMMSLPGVFTPSEAFAAIGAGADGLKLFPAEMAGLAGLRAMAAVVPATAPIFAVGGMDLQSMHVWRAAGIRGFGIGSALFQPERSLTELSRRAGEIVRTWRDLRHQSDDDRVRSRAVGDKDLVDV
jgi:2-dehydro-3-deoxyphosphogalactonate aldolase